MKVGDIVTLTVGTLTTETIVIAIASNPSGRHPLLALRTVKRPHRPVSGWVAHLDDADRGARHWTR